jgi:acyl carrier protein
MLDPVLAEKLKTALNRLDMETPDRITADLRIDDIGIDSVALSELVVLLEEDYHIDIDSEELFSIETFGELEALLQTRE